MKLDRLALSFLVLLGAAPLAPGCAGDPDPADAEATGSAMAAINNVPGDGSVACVSVTATGTWSTTKSFDVTPGQSTVFTLTGIPVGTVRFEGAAYSTPCAQVTPASIATWMAAPVLAGVQVGQTTVITLSMEQSGGVGVGVDFEPPPACRASGLPCLAGAECCSGACSNNACDPVSGGCPAGQASCGTGCIDVASDPVNCGGCNVACPAGGSCAFGACVMTPICGDGIVEPGEQCDDGNNQSGDGCSAACTLEAPTCTDMVKNGTETDLDCGGTTCPPCFPGKACMMSADCVSGLCLAGMCL